MLVNSPVRGTIKPDARFYKAHPLAILRPAGSHIPLVTQDFGPSTVEDEPTIVWPGGESDIFGRVIAAKTYSNFHRGIDISKGGCGSDILAAAPGKVTVSHMDPTNAETIVIGHGLIGGHRYETGYIHLQQRLAVVGADVVAGALIGKLGDTGKLSTACHLHFFVRKDGRFVDPRRRLLQNTSVDPDLPTPATPLPPTTPEVPDVPIPATNEEYLAGKVAVIGNVDIGARVRTGPKADAELIRTVPAGQQETWLPTCWVAGDATFGSDRWLTR